MSEKKFPVIEIFGPVIQGEGALIGQRTHFIRFGGCDYRCSWCDTTYAVLPDQVKANATRLTVDEIVHQVDLLSPGADVVTLSGGNPAMHDLEQLVAVLQGWNRDYKVVVETQGTLWPSWLVKADHVVLSPKPPSSLMTINENEFWLRLEEHSSLTDFSIKIVVFTDEDYEFAKRIFRGAQYRFSGEMIMQVGTKSFTDTASVDPIGVQRNYILNSMADLMDRACKDTSEVMYHVKVLPQLHTLAFGQQRRK